MCEALQYKQCNTSQVGAIGSRYPVDLLHSIKRRLAFSVKRGMVFYDWKLNRELNSVVQ